MRPDLADVETATLGHFLSEGFMDPAIQGLVPGARIFGPALTVRAPGDDGADLVEALSTVSAGQIIVIDRCNDRRHACWGAVTTNAAMARGAAGAVIDGFVTDLSAILALGFPVWRRGRSPLTTKMRGAGGAVGVAISCGRASVSPGDMVLADESGVVVMAPADVAAHAERARAMQGAEAGLISALHAGMTLPEINAEKLPKPG